MQYIEGGVTAAKGFLAGGVHCGIRKNKSKRDLALIYSEKPCTAAGVYTQNLVKGAPILVTQRNLADGRAQAVICNSGNANTCNADGETMDIVQQVLAGKVNKDLVQLLENTGGKAVGLCGQDGSLLKADKLPAAEDLGFVGEIREVNARIIRDSLAAGYTPVVSTVAAGYHGEVFNINADVAAARIAAELGARKLILMTDIVGLLRDKDDESTLIPVVNVSDVPKLKREGIISGGMIPKIDCCVEAVRRGVERAHIIDGRTPHSILVELFTDEGIGTMFY